MIRDGIFIHPPAMLSQATQEKWKDALIRMSHNFYVLFRYSILGTNTVTKVYIWRHWVGEVIPFEARRIAIINQLFPNKPNRFSTWRSVTSSATRAKAEVRRLERRNFLNGGIERNWFF
ncbi:hypothetical protein MMC19_005353 [Ptychographa xylographoides]|nr:hypothetical protein [Ptychographa xylographoides]